MQVNDPWNGQSFGDLPKKQLANQPLNSRSIFNHLKISWRLLLWRPAKLQQKTGRVTGQNLQRASSRRRANPPPQINCPRRSLQVIRRPLKAATATLPCATTKRRSQISITSHLMGTRTDSASTRANRPSSWKRVLTPVVSSQPTYFKDSFVLKCKLNTLIIPLNASLFTYEEVLCTQTSR